VTVSKTAHFTIGTIRLPPPIFLAGDKGAGDGTGGGVVDWNGGDLYLNMGPRSGINGLGSGPDESFIIEHVGGTASSETIKVTAGGRDQTFTNVHSIHGFGGSGNDQILVKQGVLVPVYLDGGSGDDTLIYLGSGTATLLGGSGDDVLEMGPQVNGNTSTLVMDGGDGNDFLVSDLTRAGAPGVTMIGGEGNDSIFGGTGADAIWGDTTGAENPNPAPTDDASIATHDGSDEHHERRRQRRRPRRRRRRRDQGRHAVELRPDDRRGRRPRLPRRRAAHPVRTTSRSPRRATPCASRRRWPPAATSRRRASRNSTSTSPQAPTRSRSTRSPAPVCSSSASTPARPSPTPASRS